jgi:parallel beta-helix repeat protein
MNKIILFSFTLILTSSQIIAQADFQKKLQRQLITAKDGSTITIDAGNYTLSSSLSMEGKKKVTIKGAGMNKTILSFKNQTEGAEGIRVSNAENILIEDLTVQDSKGDGIKTMNVNGITFRNVKAEWTSEANEKNGSYALYPVQCQNVMIESCTAIGASDAGIYVGQSKDIVVKNCKAYHNVAGIEIENSTNAEVFQNEATENTGGILVFDLPDLLVKKGGNVKVYNNKIYNNNYRNFAPKGNIVGKVPQGTGVLILATNNVEIYNNEILKNNSISCGIISYYMTENPIKDSLYYPYPTGIAIHDNIFERDHVKFQGKGRFGLMFRYKLRFGKNVPHIVYDGIIDSKTLDKNKQTKPQHRICIYNNKNETFVNLDAEHKFKHKSKDLSKHNCKLN